MNQLEIAKNVCLEAHAGQVDKSGKDYYLHPFRVAEMCNNTDEKIVAYLHDVVEDSSLTIVDLRKLGFQQNILDAVDCITKKTGQSYEDYIEGVKNNKIACVVKINDMLHNSDLGRLNSVTEKDVARQKKYLRYIDYLRDAE